MPTSSRQSFRIVVAIAVLLFATLGCNKPQRKYRVVFPKGFSGEFRISLNESMNALPLNGEVVEVKINPDGHAELGQSDYDQISFVSQNSYCFENGQPLNLARPDDPKTASRTHVSDIQKFGRSSSIEMNAVETVNTAGYLKGILTVK